jgi:hypothetical protein
MVSEVNSVPEPRVSVEKPASKPGFIIVAVNKASTHSELIQQQFEFLARNQGFDNIIISSESCNPRGYEEVFHKAKTQSTENAASIVLIFGDETSGWKKFVDEQCLRIFSLVCVGHDEPRKFTKKILKKMNQELFALTNACVGPVEYTTLDCATDGKYAATAERTEFDINMRNHRLLSHIFTKTFPNGDKVLYLHGDNGWSD